MLPPHGGRYKGSSDMLKVAFLDDYTHMAAEEGAWDTIRPPIDLTVFDEHLAEPDAVAGRLAPFDIIVLNRERTPMPAALIARLDRLRYIVSFGARNASLDLAACRARGIPVSGTVDESAAVAELAWGLIVALARGIVREDRAVRSGVWQEGVGIELAGKRLGLLGLGRIGGQIARIGAGFAMERVAWSANLTPARCDEVGGVRLVGKDELIATADVIVVALVASARTRGLIGADELARMKPGALLVNISRAEIVDQTALAEALARRAIAGAALDVFDTEPLPAGHPLCRLANVILTPHIGNLTGDLWRRRFAQVAENIQAFQQGTILRPMG